MSIKKRKIAFYYLSTNESELTTMTALNNVLDHIKSLDKVDRNYIFKGKKFGIIDSLGTTNDGKKHKIMFKSATHSFRPALINSNTIEERESPKKMEEGEIHKTHMIIEGEGDDVICLLERNYQGISPIQVANYLNYFSRAIESPIRFVLEAIVKENFSEIIEKMQRVKSVDIYTDKQLLTGSSMEYSDRIESAKNQIVIGVKSKPKESIKDFVQDVLAKMNGGRREITRIRVVGNNDENNELKVNTDFIERQEYVSIKSNDLTGELDSHEIFHEMDVVLHNFN